MNPYDLRVLIHHSSSDDAFEFAADDHAESLARLEEQGFIDGDVQITPSGVDCLQAINAATTNIDPSVAKLNSTEVNILVHCDQDGRALPLRTRSQRSGIEKLRAAGLIDDDLAVTEKGRPFVAAVKAVEFKQSYSLGG